MGLASEHRRACKVAVMHLQEQGAAPMGLQVSGAARLPSHAGQWQASTMHEAELQGSCSQHEGVRPLAHAVGDIRHLQ